MITAPLSHPDGEDSLPPHCEDTERAILGCILLADGEADSMLGRLQPTYFYRDKAPAFLHDLRSSLLRLQPELQTPRKLLFIACRIAQERGLPASDVLRAVDDCLHEKGLLQVRRKNPFWKAPAWSPLRKVSIP